MIEVINEHNSENIIAIQRPSGPKTKGEQKINTIWNTKALRKERTPDIKPLFKAVKKAEAKIENPEIK